ncbi:MAG: phosphatase PAP2 family protein [Actinomycetota bacterium]
MTGSDRRAGEQRLLADRDVASRIAIVMWVVAVAFSVAVAIQASAGWIQSVDDQVYTFVVEHEVDALVRFGEILGIVGSIVVMAPVMIGVAVVLVVKRRWSALTIWVVAIAVSQLASITMKNLYERPRPLLPLVETTSFSFPSGHAITGAVFAVGLMIVLVPPIRRRPSYRVIAVAYIVAMAWSRVYVRAHWLSDVTAGVAIGVAIAVTAALTVMKLDDRALSHDGTDGSGS